MKFKTSKALNYFSLLKSVVELRQDLDIRIITRTNVLII